jgi:2-hydroxychromene-2-carboxylate isomerase
MAVPQLAQREGKELEYLQAWAKHVWCESVDSTTDAGILGIAREAGLSAKEEEVVRVAREDSENEAAVWRQEAEANRERLYACGLWGVPSFAFQGENQGIFGQDRLFELQRQFALRGV